MQWLSLGSYLISCYLWTLWLTLPSRCIFLLPFPVFLLPSVSKSPSPFPFPLFFLPPSDISSLFYFLLFSTVILGIQWLFICKQKEGGEVFHFCAVAQRQGMTLFPVVLCLAWETLCTLLQPGENILNGKLKLLHKNFRNPDKISKDCRRNAWSTK